MKNTTVQDILDDFFGDAWEDPDLTKAQQLEEYNEAQAQAISALLEAVLGALPEAKLADTLFQTKTQSAYANGHNACRTQTEQNIRKLFNGEET